MDHQPEALPSQQNVEPLPRGAALRSVLCVLTIFGFWLPLALLLMMIAAPASGYGGGVAIIYLGLIVICATVALTVGHLLFAFFGKPKELPGGFGAGAFTFNLVCLCFAVVVGGLCLVAFVR